MNTQLLQITAKTQAKLGSHGLCLQGAGKNFVRIQTSGGPIDFHLFFGYPKAQEHIEMPPLAIFSPQVQEAFNIVRTAGYESRIAAFRNPQGRDDYHLEILIVTDEKGTAILYLDLKDDYFNREELEKMFNSISIRLPIDQARALCLTLEAADDGEAEGCLDSPTGLTHQAYNLILAALNATGHGWENPFEVGGAS